ncbi:MAG: MmcQ/YjbR family DNA-binding protein [Myxococcales bacterium]|nr:MmcQ/YjbR family DNA-binding protein [Myxococcales bacterium]
MSQDPGPPPPAIAATLARFIEAGLAYPEATLDHPWGHPSLKVRGKGFAFMYASAEGFSFSAKLPDSSGDALMLPFAQPTGYGLGRAGWITARFAPGEGIPEDLLLDWLDESYRAVAPKKLSKTLPPRADA